jgi:hypothetical protein
MSLPETLRALAVSLEGDEWEHPINSVEACELAAAALEAFTPDPYEMAGWDDDGIPSVEAATIELACKVWGVPVPKHIADALADWTPLPQPPETEGARNV